MEPFISVIIVSYNYEKFLPRALNACVNQTFKDFEIVIVNNGSTDNTQSIIDKFCLDHSDIKIVVKIVEKNIGLPHGRNVGIDAATGTYIMFNDADDWMDNNCLEELVKTAKETNADRVSCSYRRVDSENNLYRIVKYYSSMSKWLFNCLQGSIFRKSIFVNNNIKCPLDIIEDDLYMSTLFASYTEFNIVCDNIAYNAYINPHSTFIGSQSSIKPLMFIEDFMIVYNKLLLKIKEKEFTGFQYLFIKLCYNCIFNDSRNYSFSTVISNYKKSRDIMRSTMPGYLKNKNLFLFGNNGDRLTGQKLTWFISTCEKLHVNYLFLLLSHFILKIINIKI